MRKSLLAAAGAVIMAVPVFGGGTLWDNGPLITHPGQGFGGVDVSMASSVPNAGGSNTTATTWRADDFTVGGPGWIVSSLQIYGYDTGFATPRWDSAIIQIRQGAPDGPVMGSVAPTWGLAGINRVFNGVGNLQNTDRQLNVLTADFGGLVLDPGTYWATISITHSAGGNSWIPYVMDENPANPDDPITRVGNAMVSTDSGASWFDWIVTTGGWNQAPEMPFLVHGVLVPAPGALALLGLAGLVARRRRRA